MLDPSMSTMHINKKMGKGDLWDDSALINAFELSISKYNTMHGVGGRGGSSEGVKPATSNGENSEVDCKSGEFSSSVGHVEANDGKNTSLMLPGQAANISPNEERPSMESSSPNNHPTVKNGNLTPTKETPETEKGSPKKNIVSSNVQDEATQYPKSQEEYYQLLNKYYELQNQSQNILQQIYQYSNWSWEQPVSTTSTPESNQASIPQYSYPQGCGIYYCPYGCQSSVSHCSSLRAAHCSDGACVDETHKTSRVGYGYMAYPSQRGHSFAETAMGAAERAFSSVKKETSGQPDVSANEGKGKESERGISYLTDGIESGTDVSEALNAWYSAGYCTGKYFAKLSLANKRDG